MSAEPPAPSGPPTRRIRILVVEDQPVVAEGLALVLGREADMEVIGAVPSISEATRVARERAPEVAILDYHLPDGTAAAAAAALRAQAPGCALVVLTADAGDEAMLSSIEAGICGYIIKSETTAKIAESVRRAAAGEMLITPATLSGLLARQRQRARRAQQREELRERLTPREREILALMAQGIDNRAIAQRLEISLATARSHVQSVIEKMEAHSKLEAVVRANELGLIAS